MRRKISGETPCGKSAMNTIWSMKAAYGLMVACEWCAELQWRCECAGTPKVLSNKEMMKVVEKFKTYGQSEPGKGHGYAG